MGPIWLLALQTAAAHPAAPAPAPIRRIDFDLAKADPFDPAEIRPLQLWAQECGTADGDEIVVCGGRSEAERQRVGPLLPDPPTAMDELGEAMSVSLGPLQIGSIARPGGTRAFGIGLKF